MPLKVSSQGWVKVAPPPPKPTRQRQVDPEERKEALCAPLRYFACQGIDPGRERLRMLGARGFSSSEADLLRPHSRLERTSTLDEWRWDVQPSRSSSRQSGNIFESGSPPRDSERNRHTRGNSKEWDESRNTPHEDRDGRGSTSSRSRKERTASAPVIIPVSPSESVLNDEGDRLHLSDQMDSASVAYSETPSERACRHKHRHHKQRKPPTVIPEEDENDTISSPTVPVSDPISNPRPARSEIYSLCSVDLQSPLSVPKSTPVPTVARSNTVQSRKTAVDIPIPTPILEESVLEPTPRKLRSSRAKSVVSEDNEGSVISERSDTSSRSSRSSKSSRSSTSTTSSSSSVAYEPRQKETRTESSYTASTRSASPEPHRHDRSERNKKHNQSMHYDNDDTSSYYPSPPASPPPPIARKSRFEPRSTNDPLRNYRDRVVTEPAAVLRSSPALSASTWSSKSSSLSSRSSAPSIGGYQFQAAIFQPKSNYRGYRAPSLSKGNRWETATSALSFE